MNSQEAKAKAKACAARVAIAFAKFKNAILENWQSGLEGKIFLVAAGLLAAWVIVPFFGSAPGGGVQEKKPQAFFATPTEVLEQYYKSFMAGDVAGYVNCLDYNDEQKTECVNSLAEQMLAEEWRTTVSRLYGKVAFGVPSWDGEGKMSVKAEIENAEYGGSAIKIWYLIRKDGGWLINTEDTTNPTEMGL